MNANELRDKLNRDETDGIIQILSSTDENIRVYNKMDDKYVNYHLVPPTDAWLKARLLFCPDCKNLEKKYTDKIISLLLSLDPDILITLNHIIFVKTEADIVYACDYIHEDISMFPDSINVTEDADEESHIGAFWNHANSIVIDVNAIQKRAKKTTDNEAGYGKSEAIGIYITIVHEIRYLDLNDQYLPCDAYINCYQLL